MYIISYLKYGENNQSHMLPIYYHYKRKIIISLYNIRYYYHRKLIVIFTITVTILMSVKANFEP